MNAVAGHLANPVHGIPALAGQTTAKAMISALGSASSHELQRASIEGLAFLSYLKRFATKEGESE